MQSSHAHDHLVNEAANKESIESVAEMHPHHDNVPALALVVKAVDPREAGLVMVPAEKEACLLRQKVGVWKQPEKIIMKVAASA